MRSRILPEVCVYAQTAMMAREDNINKPTQHLPHVSGVPITLPHQRPKGGNVSSNFIKHSQWRLGGTGSSQSSQQTGFSLTAVDFDNSRQMRKSHSSSTHFPPFLLFTSFYFWDYIRREKKKYRLTLAYSESSVLLWKNATLCQWKAFSTEATDLEICVSGGRVRAKVGKSSLLEVSS